MKESAVDPRPAGTDEAEGQDEPLVAEAEDDDQVAEPTPPGGDDYMPV